MPKKTKAGKIKTKEQVCTKCGKKQPLTTEYFYKRATGRNGFCRKCISCRVKYAKLYHQKNRLKHLKKSREQWLRANYSITVGDYDYMFKKQNGVCAICKQPEVMKNQYGLIRLSVDHDHKTGKVRGLLCNRCNITLGKFEEDINLFLDAAEYLEEHNGT